MSKKIFLLLILVIGGFIGFYFYNKYRVAPSVDIQKLHLYTLDEKPFDVSTLKGKKVILSFSASWCGNCIREMNSLKKVRDTELAEFEIVIIDDEPLEQVIDFKERKQYPFTFLKLGETFPSIGINSIPVTYFYNSNLEVVGTEVGEINWLDPSTREHYKQIMK